MKKFILLIIVLFSLQFINSEVNVDLKLNGKFIHFNLNDNSFTARTDYSQSSTGGNFDKFHYNFAGKAGSTDKS